MDEAVKTAKRAHDIALSTCQYDSEEVACSLIAMGNIHYAEGRLEESLAAHEEVLGISRRLHGDTVINVLSHHGRRRGFPVFL
jgi:Tetratricopeptide repeat